MPLLTVGRRHLRRVRTPPTAQLLRRLPQLHPILTPSCERRGILLQINQYESIRSCSLAKKKADFYSWITAWFVYFSLRSHHFCSGIITIETYLKLEGFQREDKSISPNKNIRLPPTQEYRQAFVYNITHLPYFLSPFPCKQDSH